MSIVLASQCQGSESAVANKAADTRRTTLATAGMRKLQGSRVLLAKHEDTVTLRIGWQLPPLGEGCIHRQML